MLNKVLLSLIFILALIVLFLPISNLIGLQGENAQVPVSAEASEGYDKVSRILQNKCVDCHAPGMMRKPIYADLPIAAQVMDHDIIRAQSRLVLTKKLFSGEKSFTPLQLTRIEHAVRNDMMPPSLYLSMHWSGRLTSDEKQSILDWVVKERAKSPWSKEAAPEFKGEPVQPLPLTLELNAEKVALGNKLFHDPLLSGDNKSSCASCHDLSGGGTDQARVSTGIRGQQGPINAPTVYNAMYNIAQFWDGRAGDLQEQAAGPVANPVEMGARWDEVIEKLKQVTEYQEAFARIYPDLCISKTTVTDAIAVFEQSLITANSRFDQYLRGNAAALNQHEIQGYELFKANCMSCHFGPALGGLSFEKMGVKHDYFKQRGGELTEADNGRFNVTQNGRDLHVFKVPTLRNIELTYPYFHDGSTFNLAEAVRVMGRDQLDKTFSNDEVADIVAFLMTLTGEYNGKPITQLTADDIR